MKNLKEISFILLLGLGLLASGQVLSDTEYIINYHNIGTRNIALNPLTFHSSVGIKGFYPAADSVGFMFLGWFTDSELNTPVGDEAISVGTTGDVSIYAGWEEIESFEITYENVNSKDNPKNPSTYTNEKNIYRLYDPSDSSGYYFGGWYLDSEFTIAINKPVIAKGSKGEKRFYAKWNRLKPDTLYVNSYTNYDYYALSHTQNLTFENGELKIRLANGNLKYYVLKDLMSLTFEPIEGLHHNDPSSIDEHIKNGESLMFYPNPVNDILYIKGLEKHFVSARLSIIDIQGKTIAKVRQSNKVDLSHLTSGIYILQIADEDKGFTRIFVKE